jgi:hypothetical protein
VASLLWRYVSLEQHLSSYRTCSSQCIVQYLYGIVEMLRTLNDDKNSAPPLPRARSLSDSAALSTFTCVSFSLCSSTCMHKTRQIQPIAELVSGWIAPTRIAELAPASCMGAPEGHGRPSRVTVSTLVLYHPPWAARACWAAQKRCPAALPGLSAFPGSGAIRRQVCRACPSRRRLWCLRCWHVVANYTYSLATMMRTMPSE